MKRVIRMCLVVTLLSAIVIAAFLGAAGCGGGQPATSEASDSAESTAGAEVATSETAPEAEPEAEPEAPSDEIDTPEPEAIASTEPSSDEPAEASLPAPLLEWERQGGAGGHCDRMAIYPDGRVVAVHCASGFDLETVETALSEEQEAQLNGWVGRFAAFSRRESDITRAAMRTVMAGRGEAVPTTDEKTAVAKFARELFLALTATPETD
jgi:hypothetical protein